MDLSADEFMKLFFLVCDPAIQGNEAIPSDIKEDLESSKSHYIAVPVGVVTPFLGRSAGSSYEYYKHVQGVYRDKDNDYSIYRRLSLDDPQVIMRVSVAGKHGFFVDGIRWVVGPLSGKPVTFDGLINIPLLILKYGDEKVMTIDSKIRRAFPPYKSESTTLWMGTQVCPPRIEIRKGVPIVTKGDLRVIREATELTPELQAESKLLQATVAATVPADDRTKKELRTSS